MKILQINKFYHNKGKSGGTGRYLLSLINLLQKNQHQIQIFSMQDEDALSSVYSSYFIKKQDFEKISFSLKSLKKALKFIYSREAKRKINQLLQDEKPDIAHIHNIYHHLTPSILPTIKKHGVPIVQTLHDYHLISPNYSMFFQGKSHEDCSRGKYWKAIKHKCIKNSTAASFLMVCKMYFEKWSKIYIKNVDYFISPSQFLRNKYIENGFNPEKIIYLKPFINLKEFDPQIKPGKYVLYFGRLHPQKDVKILLEAAKALPNINFKIVGSGEEREKLAAIIQKQQLNNVYLLKPQYGDKLKTTIKKAALVIVPSVWFENAPFAVLESYALGKPVIASRIGGLPELVKSGKTGLLFQSGNSQELIQKINQLHNNPCLLRNMGLEARLMIERDFSPEKHYQGLMKIYNQAIKNNQKI
jgi:glycosyltransferase involved in cell wall biosynthesis